METQKLKETIFDSIATKRTIKWGFVRHAGGLYPSQCDSVAAHSNSVATMTAIFAEEFADLVKEKAGVELNMNKATLMATFHDFGEGRSGDTGASSYSTRGVCNLHFLEREGLATSLKDCKIKDQILKLFDEYRAYNSPEAILVHMADNLEGVEKAIHSAKGYPELIQDTMRIFKENVGIYKTRIKVGDKLGKVTQVLMDTILVPGFQTIVDAYALDFNIAEEIKDVKASDDIH